MELLLARSKAGHDKGKVYIVISRDKDFCYLTDGRLKPLDRPKKKRFKHVQPIKYFPEPVDEEIESLVELTDPDVKRILRLYETLRGEADV